MVTKQLWGAAAITLVIFIVVAVGRRYAAARQPATPPPVPPPATPQPALNPGKAVWFAIWPWNNKNKASVPRVHGLLVGADGRTSTSKFNALLWTVILVYFIVSLTLMFGLDNKTWVAKIKMIDPLYLVLLGGPFAAAVLAKGIVSSAVDDGSQQKTIAPKARVADVFSDDDGNTDLVDTQYVIFNLLVVSIVVFQFVHAPSASAPKIPEFLALLTGSSAVTYLANKAITTGNNAPSIDRVVPPSVQAGDHATLLGSNLIAQGDTDPPKIFINGVAVNVDPGHTAGEVNFVVPMTMATGTCTVTLRTPSGTETTAAAVAQLEIKP